MGLADYRKKRSFQKTPEPAGRGRRSGKRLRFVVQKHAATRLHYDFRLELDGVLKSWAVPKGPSLNPADKRLAMMVEDHPYDYRTFEGVISKGNYGAGPVMVWDQGFYRPYDPADDPEKYFRAGLKKGDLKFILEGSKVSGAYALVKIRGREENAWLLIKKQDAAARAEDVTKRDRSAVSGRTIEEIRDGAPPPDAPSEAAADLEATLAEAPKGRLPKNVKPMLATLVKEPFDREGWLFEIKWDGYRAIAEVRKGTAKLYSRNGQDFTERYAPVSAELESLGHDAVLDGEVVATDEQGRSRFQLLQQYHATGQGRLAYYVFDLLHLDGRDVSRLPLTARKRLLAELLGEGTYVRYSDHVEREGRAFFKAAERQRLEGVVAKDGADVYRFGRRSDSWLKVKTLRRQEAIICGYTEPRGSRKKFGALVLGVHDPGGDGAGSGKLRYIGHTGIGFDEELLELVWTKLQRHVRKSPPFEEVPKTNMPVTWVAPRLVCEVSFAEWTDDGSLRHPVFVGLREDKAAADVVLESEKSTKRALSEHATEEPVAKSGDRTLKVGRQTVKVTHWDKVFWPKEGYTKGDVVDYYRSVAKYLLPYLKGRPESLNRHPNGIEGKNFYQKDVGDLPPAWVKTKKIFSESNEKDITWLVCEDEPTLVYLANLGCIELNPWQSRVRKLDKPDYLLIDLDAKSCGFETVVEVAKEVKRIMDAIKVRGVPKTSGKTGLHICLPLAARYDYEQAKQFAEILMHYVHERHPKVTSLERNPEKRKKKIYLDFLQNRKGQTMAAPYSLRPVPGATVSTPIEWSELRKGLDPRKFTIKTIGRRLAKKGDLWKPVLGKGIDIKRALDRLQKL